MKKFILLGFMALACLSSNAQSTHNGAQAKYISLIAPIAIEQQDVYGIPASITVAQGIIESGWGSSLLATQANNHFGIKVTSDWSGEYIEQDDDAPNEKFRKYNTAEESFVDHSLFLVSRPRYASLFEIDVTDYEEWAEGLQSAGYATDRNYASNLISIIERYELDRLDSRAIPYEYQLTTTQPSTDEIDHYGTLRRTGRKVTGVTNVSQLLLADGQTPPPANNAQQNNQPQTQQAPAHNRPQTGHYSEQPVVANDGLIHYPVGKLNGRRYIVAYRGDTYAILAKMVGISETKLRLYNNAPEGRQPRQGEFIFIKKDKNQPAIINQ